MIIPENKIHEAKVLYDGQAIKEIAEHFGLNYNEETKAMLCPFHADKNPSFMWNPKSNSFHCFSAETEVITKEGIKRIDNLVNHTCEIINGNGDWEKVIFRNCGTQKLLKLILTNNGKEKNIYSTAEHEWLVKDKKNKIQTQNLKPNYKLEKMYLKNKIEMILNYEWKVVKVEETDRYESVYCCETSTHSFVLKDFILTGNCFGCSKNYDIIDLYLDQGLTFIQAVQKLFNATGIEYSFSERGLQSKPTYRYPKREINNDRSQTEKYLSLRGISKKTLDYADIQSDEYGNIAFHYYDTNDVLLNVKYRPSRKVEKGENKMWFQKDSDTTPILFNMNRIDPSKSLIINEGELDSLSLIEAGYTNTVSVPTGAQSYTWITECWDWLDQFKKIIIWSDNDEPGIKMRNECVRRLGSWRTSYIEIKDEDKRTDGFTCKDANEILYFYGKDKILEYINNPIDTPVEGVLDLSEAEDFDIESAEGLYTGIKELDDKIYKLVFGTVVLITGRAGDGKSTFANQIAISEALNQGYNCFVYSGELPAPVLRNWVETNMIGRENITMKNNLSRILDKESRVSMKNWYKGRVMMYDDSLGVTSKMLLEKMEEAVRKLGCRVITIDNLMCVDLLCSESDRLEAEKNFVKDLVLFAKKFNVLIFLLAHPRKSNVGETSLNLQSISGTSAIGNLCHMAFAIHRYTNKEKEGETNLRGNYVKGMEPKTHDSYVEVIKNRLTGLMPKVELYFDFPSYRFYKTPKELWKRYKWDENNSPIRTDDPNIHEYNGGPLND